MNKNEVSLCHKDTCVHVKGQHAEMIAGLIGIALLSITLASIIKSI